MPSLKAQKIPHPDQMISGVFNLVLKVPEALEVPQGGESRMAKMKKKISSPLVKKKPFFGEAFSSL